VEPGRQTIFGAFWAENESRENNKDTSTKNMFVFSLFTSHITRGGTNRPTYYDYRDFITIN